MQHMCLYFFALVEFNLRKIVAFVLKTDLPKKRNNLNIYRGVLKGSWTPYFS